ncbi:uncharacterized protein LOC125220959 [Salvia hispanica]|uniref:uncharacterized protein LOC125220959 n=1 Tax=Salvia hispanica TaxID=49212 RepID=UPI0020093C08|nr:uncharacterized protein LOC125220959 [Salvia hispanica]
MNSKSSSHSRSDEEISHSSSEEEVPPAPTGWDVAGFANNPVNNYISRFIQSELARMQQPPQRPIPRRRRYIHSDHAGGHDRLFADYFAEEPRYPADVFRRRFRMRRSLFLRIVNALSARYPEFRLQRDATGKLGLSPLQKCTVAIRQLAYGGSADMFDEYLQCGETDGQRVPEEFLSGRARDIWGALPSLARRSDCGSGWIGTLEDPRLSGDARQTSTVCTGSGRTAQPRGEASSLPATKTIRCPIGDSRKYFARAQESARKDVERAFGVLQARFALVKGPTRFYYQGDIADIMYACIIMHNMIIEDEHEGVLNVTNDTSVASSSHGVSTESESARRGVPYNEHERFKAFMDIHQKEAHRALQHDMIEELWANRNRAHRP